MSLPTAPRPRRRDAASTRAALIAAGTDRFASDGYEGATVDAIARDAAVNKAMISYHFGGKAGLYEAILRETLEEVGRRLAEVRASREPADRKLARFVEVIGEMQQRRPRFSALILREVLAGGGRAEVLPPAIAAIFGTLKEIVREGTRRRLFRAVEPSVVHLTIVGTLNFFFVSAPLRRRLEDEGRMPLRPLDPGEFVRQFEDLVIRGLRVSPRSVRSPGRRRA